MANRYLSITDGDQSDFSETVAVSTTTDPVIVKGFSDIVVSIDIGSCTDAKIQYTLDDEDAIDGATADWFDWDSGSVTADTSSVITKCVGLRAVNGDGSNTFKWKVLA